MQTRSYVAGHEGHPHFINERDFKVIEEKIIQTAGYGKVLSILKCLANPTKLKIYLLLGEVEAIPVTDIVNVLDVSQSTVSHALSKLKEVGVVESYRCGKLICYSLTESKLNKKLNELLKELVL